MDSIDLKIISTLSRNARTTVKELAEQVFLSSPAVTSRIEKLEKDKIIKGYHADIDFEKLGVLCSAVINFTLDSDLETEFLNYIKSQPQVKKCLCITGEFTHIMRVQFKSPKALHVFIKRLEFYGKAEVYMIMDCVKDESAQAQEEII